MRGFQSEGKLWHRSNKTKAHDMQGRSCTGMSKTDSCNVEGHMHLSARQLVCICTVPSKGFSSTLERQQPGVAGNLRNAAQQHIE